MTTETITTAVNAARAFYEASEAFDTAKAALKPFAKQQLDIMARVIEELGLRTDYRFRCLFYYDWLEFEVGSFYEGASDMPVIEIQLWDRGRCEPDSCGGTFYLEQAIIDGEVEKFEAEFRAKHQPEANRRAEIERKRKEVQIAALQAELNKLQGS